MKTQLLEAAVHRLQKPTEIKVTAPKEERRGSLHVLVKNQSNTLVQLACVSSRTRDHPKGLIYVNCQESMFT